MKRRVFKYKIVYWLILLINLILLIGFSLGLINRIETETFDEYTGVLSYCALILLFILSLASLIMFIVKNKYSIITFSSVIFVIFLTISFFVFYSVFIIKDFGENTSDFYDLPVVYGIIGAILFITNYFKFKEDFSKLEIDEIGKSE
ncbi:hypothetical protein [Chryseobacterium caseinilyticum]|uniref:Uncharacterized protein n=1 Tax=Chryseobacterium caseinilyticum TaxID=2771428 RepID=A0ABR8Z7W9_9FLAO|nr:hypothetical protein [Chryseobacterium caseinilyticum]MBD8081392.1 hypothetical protein [Chryseobacterium caseinilyticum]